MVDDPPIDHLAESPVREIFRGQQGTARVLAPSPNLLTALPVSAVPVYLTFAPAAYFDPRLAMPTEPLEAQIDWLRRAGVTHVLNTEPLDAKWPVRLRWRGIDPFLNSAM